MMMTLGETLRTTRENLGLSVSDVASQIKLSERQIRALEADDYAHLPNIAFVRGFVRSYAKMLRLDAVSLLASMPQTAVMQASAQLKPMPSTVSVAAPTPVALVEPEVVVEPAAQAPVVVAEAAVSASAIIEPVASELVVFEAVVSGSVVSEPVVSEPVVSEAEPVVSEPVVSEAVVVVSEPVVSEPVVSEPVVSEPVVSEPVVSEPVVSEPVVSEPVVSEPVVSEPVVSEPVVSEPVVSEPVVPTKVGVQQTGRFNATLHGISSLEAPFAGNVARRRQQNMLWLIGAALVSLAAIAFVVWNMNAPKSPAPPPPEASVDVPKTTPEIESAQSLPLSTPLSGVLPVSTAAPVAPMAGVLPPAASVQTPPPPTGPIRLVFREESWTEVREQSGRVLTSQLNAPGSTLVLDGAPPFAFVIGNYSGVQLFYHGKEIDLEEQVTRPGSTIVRFKLEE